MGREIKRVPLDFNWPLNRVWKGFINPYQATECQECGGSGYNPATKALADGWYNLDGKPEHPRSGWSHHITQDEVDALLEKGRLFDFTKRGNKHPTAAEVNEWSLKFIGHDCINRWICIETRAKRLGVYGKCLLCGGRGEYWCDDKYAELSETWEPIEPPNGEGWQLWETVSEGSPISPVFKTVEEFKAHLKQGGYSDAAVNGFVEAGSCMSGIYANGHFYSGIEAGELNDGEN